MAVIFSLASVLFVTGCVRPRPRVILAPVQVDAFAVACGAGSNCRSGAPTRSFTTSRPPAGELLVTRNGLTLYGGAASFDYATTANAAGLVTVAFTSQPVVDGDLIVLRYAVGQPAPQPPANAAQFIRTDPSTKGNWIGVYGADGYWLHADATKAPAYGSVTVQGHEDYTWPQFAGDPRALVKATNPAERIASAWYSYTSFTIDVNLTDGNLHQLAIYSVDYDDFGPRSQKVEVLDATTGAVLDTRDQPALHGGEYLVWQVRGHLTIRVTRTQLQTESNCLVSGIFLG